ncbi:MAG: Planctomycete cytochrome, partial [Verrucomicrobiaceae bacterium]|nr:Planctomycete cytochrome [Verrucomicrobiaceae bacterium]
MALAVSHAQAAPLTFEKDVRPILKVHCFRCHGEAGEMKGKLDVRLTRFLLKGGKEGPEIVPGKSAASHLIELVNKGDMPKGKPRLPDKDLATLTAWIDQGAKTARPEPLTLGPEHVFTEEEREWWAFQPIKRSATPVVGDAKATIRNPIDSFIVEKLKQNQLTQSPEADPVTYIRRATFDLTGLPPSPEEVDAYVAASIKNPELAQKQLIDRLLESPAYGERWGRHWLDVAGYADSDGYSDKDVERKYAFKYRDYVIKALNTDKPFDQFVREQLAGDEMVPQPHKNLSPESIEKLTATGFLRMAPDGTGSTNDTVSRNASIAETIKIVSTSLYGMTVGCAQCHDHRYDPITQADYYRLRAVFEPGFDTKSWRTPIGRLVSLLTDSERAISAKIEEEAKKLDVVRLAKQEEFIAEVLEKEMLKRDAGIRDALREAYKAVKKTPAQVKLLKDNPSVQKLTSASLYLYDSTYGTSHASELKKMLAEATAVRAKKPVEEFVHAFEEQPKTSATIPATFVFNRGDPEQPKEKVTPGELSILASQRKVDFAEKAPSLPTTGRRLAFANSLTDGKHPLLARVMVNRVWAHHFGKGIVPSVGDFGQLGQKPSHPELLDWLASEFMTKGWSLKNLHRLIMTSAAYRQSSKRDAERERIDPDNRLLSRQNVRRLEAETLRDSLLDVGG